MSDNTPTDGKKNAETDAASSDLTAAQQPTSQHEPEHAAPEPADVPADATSAAPEQEPLVIDYDAINADLSAVERADAFSATERAAATARNLPSGSPAAPVDAASAAGPSLADDYADSAEATVLSNALPATTVPATSTAVTAEPATMIVAEPLLVAPAAAAATPVDYGQTTPTYTPPAQQSPIYVQAPTKPRDRSNRGGGILIALLATVVFAALYAVAAFIIIGVTSATIAATVTGFTTFAALPVFYVPVVFFFLAYTGLIALVNRGGWWAYVLFGFIVGVVVYFSYIGGALLGLVLDGTSDNVAAADISRFVASLWLNPGAIAAGLIAREVPIWAGAWIARRGRRVTARNLEARTEYERLLADGPQVSRP
jgi:hypothetical protein